MDTAYNPIIPFLLLICAAIYSVVFISVCLLVPPHPRRSLGSFLLDLAGCAASGVLAALIFCVFARFAWNFVTSYPIIFGLTLPLVLGLGLGYIYARTRRLAALPRRGEGTNR